MQRVVGAAPAGVGPAASYWVPTLAAVEGTSKGRHQSARGSLALRAAAQAASSLAELSPDPLQFHPTVQMLRLSPYNPTP